MFKRRIIITIITVIIFSALSCAIYFTFFTHSPGISEVQQNAKDDVMNPSVEALNLRPKADMVTDRTKVKIKYTYLIDSNYTINREVYDNNVINSIVGMNEEQVRKFYENMNYKLEDFSTDEITVLAEIINSWPPNSFVVKSNIDEIFIYTVDSQGMLTLPQKTGLYLDMLPSEDKDAVIKGKVYYKYEDVEDLLDDYKS